MVLPQTSIRRGQTSKAFGQTSISTLWPRRRGGASGPPTPQIQLSASTIAESASIGTTVGVLSVSNGSGTYTFTETADPDTKFAVSGSNLNTAAALDYETATSHSVTIQASNGVDAPFTRVFTITVTDVVESTEIPWTPAMIGLIEGYNATAWQAVKLGGGTPVTGDRVTSIVGTQNGTVATPATPATTNQNPLLAAAQAPSPHQPLRFTTGELNNFRSQRNFSASGIKGWGYALIFARSSGITAATRVLAGVSSTSTKTWALLSSATLAGGIRASSGGTPTKTVTTDKYVSLGWSHTNTSTGQAWVDGEETTYATGTGDSDYVADYPIIGNSLTPSTSGANFDLYGFWYGETPTANNLTRANMQRMEGYAHHLLGLPLPAGHPYEFGPPMVPVGTTSTIDWDDINVASAAAQQSWIGHYIEGQTDSYDGIASQGHYQPTDSTTNVWGFPYSLNSTPKAAIKADLFSGDGFNIKYFYIPLGFGYRGLRNIDGTSGLAKNIGERFSGQNASIATLLGNGIKVAFQYHSPAPHWKMSSAYGNGTTTRYLWAGGSYPRTRSLPSLKSTVTMTIATPGVVTWTAHGFANDTPVKFETTGALPTGITAGTTYYIRNQATNTFELATAPGGASIATSGTQSGVHTAREPQYDVQVDAFATAVVDDMEYVHQNLGPLGMFGLQNEADNTAVAGYGHCEYAGQEYNDIMTALIPKIDASSILPDVGLNPSSNILVHTNSLTGFSGGSGVAWAAANPTKIWAGSFHRITDIYPDADYIRTNAASWLSSRSIAGIPASVPYWDNEYEHFGEGATSDAYDCANNMLCWAHCFELLNAPAHNPILHFMKEFGADTASSNLNGYALAGARLPAPFGQDPSTPGDPDPSVNHGEYRVEPQNYNSASLTMKNLKEGSTHQPFNRNSTLATGTQVTAARTPTGKLQIYAVNRTAADVVFSIGVGPSKAMTGKRYNLTNLGVAAGSKNASRIVITVPAYSGEVWEEA